MFPFLFLGIQFLTQFGSISPDLMDRPVTSAKPGLMSTTYTMLINCQSISFVTFDVFKLHLTSIICVYVVR